MNESATSAAAITAIAAAFVFFGAIALDIHLIRRWKGPWRIAACLPLAALAVLAVAIVAGILVDPTSHNLWPFELLLWGAGALLAMGILALARRIFNKS